MGLFGKILADFPDIKDVFAELPSPYDDVRGSPLPDFSGGQGTLVDTLFSAEQAVAPYDVWHLETRMRWQEGIGAMPVAPPIGGTSPQNKIGVLPIAEDKNRQAMAIPRLSAPFGFMVVFWVGRRAGAKPTVPKPAYNANAVFAESDFGMTTPTVLEDNTQIHSWWCRYLFLLQQPIWLLDGMNPGRSPAHTLQTTDNVVPASKFDQVF